MGQSLSLIQTLIHNEKTYHSSKHEMNSLFHHSDFRPLYDHHTCTNLTKQKIHSMYPSSHTHK